MSGGTRAVPGPREALHEYLQSAEMAGNAHYLPIHERHSMKKNDQ